MSKNIRKQIIYILAALFAALPAACSPPAAEIAREDMIQPGDKIGEAVLRNVVDESETRPLLFELCGDLQLAELSEEKRVECVVDYQPTIFLGGA